MKLKTYIYIDGFNLFHRGLKNTSYKWLDLKALFRRLLDNDKHEIVGIKYFTAIVSGKFDPQKPIRQQAYLRALQHSIPEISIHYGQFMSHNVWAPFSKERQAKHWKDKKEVLIPLNKIVPKNSAAEIIKTEEKGSDVNLAVHLLNDAWLKKYDCAIVLSNDSDLKEAITLVKEHHKKLIGLVLPPNCFPSKELMEAAHFVKQIRNSSLAASQLPDAITGTNIHKPEGW